jgi:hypothetical protein
MRRVATPMRVRQPAAGHLPLLSQPLTLLCGFGRGLEQRNARARSAGVVEWVEVCMRDCGGSEVTCVWCGSRGGRRKRVGREKQGKERCLCDHPTHTSGLYARPSTVAFNVPKCAALTSVGAPCRQPRPPQPPGERKTAAHQRLHPRSRSCHVARGTGWPVGVRMKTDWGACKRCKTRQTLSVTRTPCLSCDRGQVPGAMFIIMTPHRHARDSGVRNCVMQHAASPCCCCRPWTTTHEPKQCGAHAMCTAQHTQRRLTRRGGNKTAAVGAAGMYVYAACCCCCCCCYDAKSCCWCAARTKDTHTHTCLEHTQSPRRPPARTPGTTSQVG